MRVDEIVLVLTMIFSLITFIAQVISLGFPPLSFLRFLARLLILVGWCTAMSFAFIIYVFSPRPSGSLQLSTDQLLNAIGVCVLNVIILWWVRRIVPVIVRFFEERKSMASTDD